MNSSECEHAKQFALDKLRSMGISARRTGTAARIVFADLDPHQKDVVGTKYGYSCITRVPGTENTYMINLYLKVLRKMGWAG